MKTRSSLLPLAVIICCLAVSARALGNQNLSNILLGRLHHTGRPALNTKDQLIVNVLGALYQLVDVDQRNNLATVSAYFDLRWSDLNLKWDPEEFNGTKEMYLPSSSVWLPELYLYHSVEGSTPIGIQDSAVQVQYFGEVRIFVPFTARALCPINVKYFPFDRQWCNFTFGSWSYKVTAVKFVVESDQVNLDDFYDNQEWVLLKNLLKPSISRYKTKHRDEQYSTVIMELKLQRQSFYYVFNLMIPTTLVSLTAIIGFHAPSNAVGRRENKFRLGITTLLSMGVMLLMVVDEMPKFALSSQPGQRGSFSDVPLLGLFYLSLILTISLGTCTSSIFVLLEHYGSKLPHRNQIPRIIRWLDFDWTRSFYLPSSQQNHIEQQLNPGNCDETSDSYRKALETQNSSPRIDEELILQLENVSKLLGVIAVHLSALNQRLNGRSNSKSLVDSKNDFYLSKSWRRIINRLVLISLITYLVLVSFIIFCFFYPHWWY